MLCPRTTHPLRRIMTSFPHPSSHFSAASTSTFSSSDNGINASASSVNTAEISHFSRLSSRWWDEQGEFGLLHKMNPPRMQFIRDKVLEIAREDEDKGEEWVDERNGAEFLRGVDVLDVGCGGGILSEVGVSPFHCLGSDGRVLRCSRRLTVLYFPAVFG